MDCIMVISINIGIVLFKKNDFIYGFLLYFCVWGENKLYGCSDGILVDVIFLKIGRIVILNVNGFIFMMLVLLLYVELFLEDVMLIGIDEILLIVFYEYVIGIKVFVI